MAEDLYQVLGVPRSADLKAIRRAYREKARKYHPDVNKDPSAEETFKRISEAHDVLSDPESRSLYDRFGENFRQYENAGSARRAPRTSARQPGAEPPYQTWTGFSGNDPTGVNWEDLFGDVFTGPRSGRGANLSAELELTVEEAFRGGRRTVSVSDLAGRSRQYDIDIPAGVRDGERIRVPGAGGEGREGVGDMLITIRVNGGRKYRLDGADIEMDLPVTPWEAALGAEVLTHTPGGPVTVHVPAGSSSGRRLRLRGQGMPRPGGRAGDLYARVKIMVPPKLTPRERELFEQLRDESRFQPRRAS